MNRKMIFLAVTALALVSLACSININLPDIQTKTGPTVTDDIIVPLLTDNQAIADVTMNFGAGKLNLKPGATGVLLKGTATYNVADFKPEITTDSNNINIEQGNVMLTGIPTIGSHVINEWNLSLGESPMSLTIKAGAYEGTIELGGLSIHKLDVTDGASKVNLSFAKPNLIEMTELKYTTGASTVSLTGLADANISDLTFNGGAGSYTLDFGGKLQHDMNVSIESGVSSITVIIPEGTNALVITDNGLSTVTTSGSWQQNGNNYRLAGTGSTITIHVKLGAGSLRLETGK
jgi:hypothetical protein